ILRVAERLPSLPVEQQAASSRALSQLSTVVAEATGRLQQVIRRMQRFSNLDEAEVREIDLAQLLTDILELHAPVAERKVHVRMDVQNVPKFEAPPQALSGALPALLNRAITTAEPDGSVHISAALEQLRLRVVIEYTGNGDAFDKSAFEP